MKHIGYDDLSVFVEVAKVGGFRAAAQALNIGAGSVSETVQRMENRLGVRLIERTTRKISLTAAGENLLQRALPALTDLADAMDDLSNVQNAISGTLRLSAPRSSAPFFLDAAISAYALQYPQVQVEMMYDDRKIDLVTSGVDAAIRSQTLLEKETHAIEIGPALTMALVASPAYLELNGTPKKPRDLAEHDGIRFGFGRADQLAPWSFVDGQKKPFQVTPKPCMIVNELMSMIHFARDGIGLAYVYRQPAEPFITSGELVTLFDRQIPVLPRYSINYLTKRHMPPRLRAFIDLAKNL